ncbi:MAG TPA: hypothetical protein VNB90_04985 [Cytophagaceae bacterium]|jgi:hypothetical protein|nr:hypothetical protein [Cytophagaceae bacterium]
MVIIKQENEWVWMELRESHFLVTYKPNTILDLQAAQTIIREATELAGDKVYPALTDIKDMPSHPKEVRQYFANEGSHNATANAILVSSSINKIMANFFLTLNKPTVPTRLFTDANKAIKWLEMFPVIARPALVQL